MSQIQPNEVQINYAGANYVVTVTDDPTTFQIKSPVNDSPEVVPLDVGVDPGMGRIGKGEKWVLGTIRRAPH